MSARLLLVLLVAGCSDYGIGAATDWQNTTDTGAPAVPDPSDQEALGGLSGRLCDDGVALGGAHAWVEGPDGVVETWTNADGYFLLDGLPPGETVLNVRSTDGTYDTSFAVMVYVGSLTALPDYECPTAGDPNLPPLVPDDDDAPPDGAGTPVGDGDSGAPLEVPPGDDDGGDTGAPLTAPNPDPDDPRWGDPSFDPPGRSGSPGRPDLPDTTPGGPGCPEDPDTGAAPFPDGGAPGTTTPGTGGPDDPRAGEDLCRTQGYWKNHPGDWPVQTLTLGDETVTAAEAIALLDLPTGGDASLILVHQLIPARLNLKLGAPDLGISTVVADADAWLAANDLGALPYGIDTASVEGAEAVDLADELDAFNNLVCW